MRIKRIEADTIADALRELRRELGDHALILHTKQLPPKGISGLFKAPRVEIIGAVDEPGLVPYKIEPGLVGSRIEPGLLAAAAAHPAAARSAPGTPPAVPAAAPAKPGKRARRVRKRGAADPVLEGAAAPMPSVDSGESHLAGVTVMPAEWQRMGRRARRIAFVGPTGAGKTTTLAKIAARAQIEHGRRVGLVTIDTYRIGAVPQLSAYAEILGVPLVVAQTPEELAEGLIRLDGCDLIFIDTVGRSPLGGGVDGLVPFLAAAAPDEIHLVLSATTRPGDSTRAAGSFARLSPNRLIITKIDETDDHAGLAVVCRATGLPLSWFGVGQEVPDDLESASLDRLAQLVGAGCAA